MSGTIDFSQFSLLELFCMEVETQVGLLNTNLLALETEVDGTNALVTLMRAAHSIKGAARIVQFDAAVDLAHAMEDCFVAAQAGTITLTTEYVDVLLQSADLLLDAAKNLSANPSRDLADQMPNSQNLVARIAAMVSRGEANTATASPGTATDLLVQSLTQLEPEYLVKDSRSLSSAIGSSINESASNPSQPLPVASPEFSLQNPLLEHSSDTSPVVSVTQNRDQKSAILNRSVRVRVDNLNRLMALAGESLVEANRIVPFADALTDLKVRQSELSVLISKLERELADSSPSPALLSHLKTLHQKADECRQLVGDRQVELELFSRRSIHLADRLHREVMVSHMCPFEEGGKGFPRLVRDLAKELGKEVRLEVCGKTTNVDRDILERLEVSLTHLLQNAIDHGIELPQERLAAGKPAHGTIRIEAAHRAGMLVITVTDDGRGVNFEQLRQDIIRKQLIAADLAKQLTKAELMEFLFLPGFSTQNTITNVSGRGTGLDIVHTMVRDVGGTIRAVSNSNEGMSFHLQLPLALSVVRTLLVEIAGEPYALPLPRVDRVLMLPRTAIEFSESHPYFLFDDQAVGLVPAHQIFELPAPSVDADVLPVVVISEALGSIAALGAQQFNRPASTTPLSALGRQYGLIINRFLGERTLVVSPLDARFGKIPNISATAILEDGSPVLVVDVEDLIRSIDSLLTKGSFQQIKPSEQSKPEKRQKRILVVDDSITVREMERKLLENKGYSVEVAVNGMDGWNAVRNGHFDLVVTDIDMPRMNGIELVSQIKSHIQLKNLPVIIVSYKDREENRIQGLEAGADYYLTKSSFHDDTLLHAVLDLIGAA